MVSVEVVYCAPVPVGHRLEVIYYRRPGTGGIFGSKPRSEPHQPLLRDLDTGIEYISDFALGSVGAKYPSQPLAVGDDVVAELEVERRIVGKVRSCRVITVRGFSEFDVQTQLSIEPDDDR